jgi:hypothetical protein
MSVVQFLTGEAADAHGRTIKDVLQQGDEWLEQEHNYIQWLFPLLDESAQVHDAPVLSPEDVTLLRASSEAQSNQQAAVERMLQFYANNTHWLTETDHNHLRITRILKSVRLLQSLEAAEVIYNILMEQLRQAGSPIAAKNVAFWTDAVGLSYDSKNYC